jgi:exopolysaccharide biosynthesis polyprenyl glycosylphosphotransferase
MPMQAAELSGPTSEAEFAELDPALAGAGNLHGLRREDAALCPGRSVRLARYVGSLVGADCVAAGASAGLAIVLRFGVGPAVIQGVPYAALVPGFLVAWPLTMWLAGTYDERVLVSGPEAFRRVVNGSVWLLAAIAITSVALRFPVSRAIVGLSLPAVTILSLAARQIARTRVQRRLARGETLHQAVVVGTVEEAGWLESHMRRNSRLGFAVTGVHEPFRADRQSTGDFIGNVMNAVAATDSDTIALAGTGGFNSLELRSLAWGLERTGVKLVVVPAVTYLAGPRISVRPLDGLPLLHIAGPQLAGPKLVLKRAVDVIGATFLVALLMPVMVICGLLVLISSGAPVLYSQTRVGRNGDLFKMYKFRTMVRGADQMEGAQVAPGEVPVRRKLQRDPRVSRLGRFLRHRSLDELPQLFNVLGGSMSLVGPRPHRPDEVTNYADDARRRLLIKPGLTGLWQVSGRAALSWEEAVRLDLRYVEHWSMLGDAALLVRTLRSVLFPRGAY